MIKVLTLFTFLFSFSSAACEFNVAETIYIYGESNSLKFDSKNCKASEVDLVINVLKDAEGSINTKQLRRITGIKNLTLKPHTIRVRSLEQVIHSRLSLSNDSKLVILDQNVPTDFFLFKNDQFLEASCSNCNQAGITNIKLSKTNGTDKQTVWMKAKLMKAVEALVSNHKANLDFNGIYPKTFSKKTVFTLTPNEVVTSNVNLTFYRLNKSIPKDHILKRNEITPVQLVKYGTPTKVIIDSPNLKMSTTAMPLSQGNFGDTIKLKNTKSNKIFLGKIIDKNTVKVEL